MILKDKVVLVTGGTGSMGKTFVKRALSGVEGLPRKIIILSRDEAKQHFMRLSYSKFKNTTDEIIYQNFSNLLEFRIGDVRNYSDVLSGMQDVDIVINAAALKQVPTCEYFPQQAIDTNCLGPTNIVRAVRENELKVQTVVGVSTDKACKPVNVMGMTKAIQERIFTSANVLCDRTRFVCVRYGNVLASRGSVIPLFHEQLRRGGPLTITDDNMTRFLLSLEDAVDTVIAAITYAKEGETFIPIAPAANMVNVAKALIGDRGIEIKNIGIRPGEKLYESLISEEESFRTYRTPYGYYSIQPILPEVQKGELQSRDLIGEYSSDQEILDLQGTVELLKKNNLMFDEDAIYDESNELIG